MLPKKLKPRLIKIFVASLFCLALLAASCGECSGGKKQSLVSDKELDSKVKFSSNDASLEEAEKIKLKLKKQRETALKVRFVANPPIIDGKLDDDAWKAAFESEPFGFSNIKAKGKPHLQTSVRLLWDDEHLYIGFFAEDDDIWATRKGRDEALWEEEVVEAYLMPSSGKGYIELQVNPLGGIFDAYFTDRRIPDWQQAAASYNPNVKAKVFVEGTANNREDKDKFWSVEIALAFSELAPEGKGGGKPGPGERWKANFYRFERKEGRRGSFAAALYPLSKPDFHFSKDWGLIEFMKDI